MTAGNFFNTHANRGAWEGVLTPTWRCFADTIRGDVQPRKPLCSNQAEIKLKKGKPLRVMWLKE